MKNHCDGDIYEHSFRLQCFVILCYFEPLSCFTLSDYDGRIIYDERQTHLRITNLTLNDEGVIECEVILSTGAVLKNSTNLIVLGKLH